MKDQLELSAWFNGLGEVDQAFVARIVRQAADEAVFGFLCVLDGVRAIEDGPVKGDFELRYRKDDGHDVQLCPVSGPYLHDLFL